MFMYGFATFLLHMRAPRTDALLNGADEPEPEPVKHIVGVADRVVSSIYVPPLCSSSVGYCDAMSCSIPTCLTLQVAFAHICICLSRVYFSLHFS